MKLFPRIFLSFWIATVLMIGFAFSISEMLPPKFPGNDNKRFEPDVAIPALSTAVNTYEQQGAAGFHSQIWSVPMLRHRSLHLFDERGNPLVTGLGDSPLNALIAKDVSHRGHSEFIHFGLRMLYACPLQSATGRHYAVVLTMVEPGERLLNPRFWFNIAVAMFPAGLVCMALTLYLTRPIIKLQTAARRLAAGELDARAGPLRWVRRDELGDLARDFDAMAAQIQVLMTAQRRFVADVSHELGGPLTRMHLSLALLRREFARTKSGALLRIERETDKLSNLVQQLLLLAGLEAGRIPAEVFAPVSIGCLCESIIEDANFEAAHAECQIIGSREDSTVLVYPNLLRRAIDNVLRNAIRYAPANTKIELDCKVDMPEREITITIRDCGPGVPDDMLVDIFTPFFRTAPGRETSSGGTGLGLAIASEAVRLHDGTIRAQNRPSGGLQVTITLPLRTPEPDPLASDTAIAVQEYRS